MLIVLNEADIENKSDRIIKKDKVIETLMKHGLEKKCADIIWQIIKRFFCDVKKYYERRGVEEKLVINEEYINIGSIIGVIRINLKEFKDVLIDPKLPELLAQKDIVIELRLLKLRKLEEHEVRSVLEEVADFMRVFPSGLRSRVFLEFQSPLLSSSTIDRLLMYSVLLEELSYNILREYMPLTTKEYHIVAPSIVGKVDLKRTIRTFLNNFCFVSKRKKVILNFPPLVLLAYFNMDISQNLRSYRDVLGRSKEYLGKRISIHNSIVRTYPLSYVKTFIDEYNFHDRNTISKILHTTIEPIWEQLVRLWVGYIGECSLLEDILLRSLSNPHNMRMLVPMSKIYEFYVFYKLVKAICDSMNIEMNYDLIRPCGNTSRGLVDKDLKLGNLCVNIGGRVLIFYNCEVSQISKKMGVEYKSGEFVAKLRPDIVIIPPNRDKLFIIDAKYKILEGRVKSDDRREILEYLVVIGAMLNNMNAYRTNVAGVEAEKNDANKMEVSRPIKQLLGYLAYVKKKKNDNVENDDTICEDVLNTRIGGTDIIIQAILINPSSADNALTEIIKNIGITRG